jgi:hypothetical protein
MNATGNAKVARRIAEIIANALGEQAQPQLPMTRGVRTTFHAPLDETGVGVEGRDENSRTLDPFNYPLF